MTMFCGYHVEVFEATIKLGQPTDLESFLEYYKTNIYFIFTKNYGQTIELLSKHFESTIPIFVPGWPE